MLQKLAGSPVHPALLTTEQMHTPTITLPIMPLTGSTQDSGPKNLRPSSNDTSLDITSHLVTALMNFLIAIDKRTLGRQTLFGSQLEGTVHREGTILAAGL